MSSKQSKLEAKKNPVELQEMKLLDFFAALAAIGTSGTSLDPELVAAEAYKIADALLKERQLRL